MVMPIQGAFVRAGSPPVPLGGSPAASTVFGSVLRDVAAESTDGGTDQLSANTGRDDLSRPPAGDAAVVPEPQPLAAADVPASVPARLAAPETVTAEAGGTDLPLASTEPEGEPAPESAPAPAPATETPVESDAARTPASVSSARPAGTSMDDRWPGSRVNSALAIGSLSGLAPSQGRETVAALALTPAAGTVPAAEPTVPASPTLPATTGAPTAPTVPAGSVPVTPGEPGTAPRVPESISGSADSPVTPTHAGGPAQTSAPSSGDTRSAVGYVAAESTQAGVSPAVPLAQPVTQAAPAVVPVQPTATVRPAQPLTTQLVQPLFTLAASGQGEHRMTLHLTPENLGPVTVRAVIAGDDIRIEMFSPTDTGREALRQILVDLRRDLASGGLPASLDLSAKDHFDERGEHRAHDTSPGPSTADTDTTADEGTQRATRSGSLSSTLDITL